MKLSLDWLSDFVSFSEKDPEKIAERLTMGVAEVEEIEMQGALLQNCCVGKVLSIEKHPDADKLTLCDVETDRGKKRVVCGGTNLRERMLVAFAHVGAKVNWHGEEIMELTKTKIRGEESEGMICGAEELELETQFPDSSGRNIVDMGDEGYEVGTPLKEALALGDVVFHIDNHSITHRPDLFSHFGFARECVALGLGKWKKFECKPPTFTKDKVPFTFKVDEPKLMPRYCACLIEIEGIGETPDWMKRRLAATGWRSLSLPIDITNYVMMEVGVPLHSFDADDIIGTAHMRKAKKGEKITTLDKKEFDLPEGALILSDDEGVFDLLGIMGGLRSSTKDSTRRIYLHSASLDHISIRRAMQETGLRTDAGGVYEKGVPHITAEQGFHRAIDLFLQFVPGARVASLKDERGDNGSPDAIELSLPRVSSYLGREVKVDEVTNNLEALDFTVKKKGKDAFSVTPPLHRLGDIDEEVDLIEEIARVSGYDTFEAELPEANIAPPPRDKRLHRMREALQDAGFTELVQFAFLGEENLRKAGMSPEGPEEISNPLGADLKLMRPSLLPRMLEFAEENLGLADDALSAFEIGKIFRDKGEELSFSLLVSSKKEGDIRQSAFLRAKAATKEGLAAAGYEASFMQEKGEGAHQHPARTVSVSIGKEKVGTLYEVHPSISAAFDLPRTAVLECNLDALLAIDATEKVFREVSSFPSIVYDTTVSISPSVQVGSLLEKVSGSYELLTDIHLQDLYQKGAERNLTFRCTYNAPDRTLTEEEVKPVHEKVEAALRSG